MMRAALEYARRLNWPVMPLEPREKEPLGRLVPHGVYDATTDQRTIRSWWERCPTANVGLACGHGFFVLDVDPRNGGDDTLGRYQREHGELPDTPQTITGGGGAHILFKLREGERLHGVIGEGLDIKGPHGYIVAPPSIHPNGTPYQWEAIAHPLDLPIAEPPEWLARMVYRGALRKPTSRLGKASGSFVARVFDVAGWLGEELDEDRVMARCPWSCEHSAGERGERTGEGEDSSCVVFAPSTDSPLGRFHCSHSHCANRGTTEALREAPTAAVKVVAIQRMHEFEMAVNLLVRWAP